MAFDLFNGIRQQRMFAPPEEIGVRNSGVFNPTEEQPQVREPMQERFTLPEYETPALDMYKQHINTMPEQANYKNPVIQKILAGVAGFSTLDPNAAFATTRNILDAPYNRDVGDYKMKGNQLGELADIEATTSNIDYRRHIAEADQQRKDEAEARMGATAESTIERNKAYIKNLQDKAKREGKVLKNNKVTGKLEFVDLATGAVTPTEAVFDLPEATKRDNVIRDYKQRTDYGTNAATSAYKVRNDYATGNAQATHQINTDYSAGVNQDTHEANRLFDVGHPMPSTARPPAPTVIMPSQQATARKLAIERALTTRPEWAKFIVDGIPTNKKAGWMGASQAEYDQDFKNFTKAMGDEEKKIIAETKSARAPVVPINPPEADDDIPTVQDPETDTDTETTEESAAADLADEEDGEFEFDDGSKWQKINGVVSRLE